MKKKAIVILVLLAVLCIPFYRFYYTMLTVSAANRERFMNNSPLYQFGSVWQSENGIIEFAIPSPVSEDMSIYGTLQTPEGKQDIYLTIYGAASIDIYSQEGQDNGSGRKTKVHEYYKALEHWGGDFYAEDEFRVTVNESTYFSEKDSFIVHRVQEPIVNAAHEKYGTNCPSDQKNTVWRSDGGEIEFSVDGPIAQGELNVSGGTTHVAITFGMITMDVYSSDGGGPIIDQESGRVSDQAMKEKWIVDYYSPDEFCIYIQDSMYFKEGDSFIVHRI